MSQLLCRDRRRTEAALAAHRLLGKELAKQETDYRVVERLCQELSSWQAFEPNWRLWLAESGLSSPEPR